MSDGPDLNHLARIDAVLRALAGCDTARAMLVCEDAFVALAVGLRLGLTTERIAALHAELKDEFADQAARHVTKSAGDSERTH